jgi:hypothetical protein
MYIEREGLVVLGAVAGGKYSTLLANLIPNSRFLLRNTKLLGACIGGTIKSYCFHFLSGT